MKDRAVTPQQRKVWDVIEASIEAQTVDGIGAEGTFSEIVAEHQRSLVSGMRAARLAALSVIGNKG